MNEGPLRHIYNLARLGKMGDEVRFEAGEGERDIIAKISGVVSVARFAVTVTLKKTSPSRFMLDYRLEAEATLACVVTLELVPAHIEQCFMRELHFAGAGRRPVGTEVAALDMSAALDGEEIESLHYDLAGPALEEYLLALDPYPRCPGVEFAPDQAAATPPENPFLVLKSLKNRS